jgi:hypothetical protein
MRQALWVIVLLLLVSATIGCDSSTPNAPATPAINRPDSNSEEIGPSGQRVAGIGPAGLTSEFFSAGQSAASFVGCYFTHPVAAGDTAKVRLTEPVPTWPVLTVRLLYDPAVADTTDPGWKPSADDIQVTVDGRRLTPRFFRLFNPEAVWDVTFQLKNDRQDYQVAFARPLKLSLGVHGARIPLPDGDRVVIPPWSLEVLIGDRSIAKAEDAVQRCAESGERVQIVPSRGREFTIAAQAVDQPMNRQAWRAEAAGAKLSDPIVVRLGARPALSWRVPTEATQVTVFPAPGDCYRISVFGVRLNPFDASPDDAVTYEAAQPCFP